jgi:hypothetical protein
MRANHGEQKKSKKKEKSRKKTGAQKTSSFSRFETTNFETKQHTLVRVLRDISSCLSLSLSLSLSRARRRRGRSKRRAFLLVPLLKSEYLRRRKKTKDDGVDFLRVVVVQFRRHPKKGATT